MKKVIVALFFAFVLLGMIFSSAFVLAEEGGNSDNNVAGTADNSDSSDNSAAGIEDNSAEDDSGENESDDSAGQEEENQEDEAEQIRERIRNREHVQSEFSREVISEDGARVRIEREIESENGETKIKIKKTITFENGTKQTIEIEIERDENGEIRREIKIEGENIGIDSDLEINDLFEGNESELEVVLSDGNTTRIKVLPEQARERVRERLRTGNITNFSLEEIEDRNIPHVVYNIETNQQGRFLGVFKLALKSETQIDPETGEVIDINRPWWAFLVSVSDEENTNDNSENTDTTENSLISYEEALAIAQNSNCTADGTLNEEHWYNNGSRTWWIDLNLSMEGCNPACVVSEETRTAEINYMCTGLLLE